VAATAALTVSGSAAGLPAQVDNFRLRLPYQPPLLSSQNKPASMTFLSEQISTSHQPNEQAAF
jgi:hypothetical protein